MRVVKSGRKWVQPRSGADHLELFQVTTHKFDLAWADTDAAGKLYGTN